MGHYKSNLRDIEFNLFEVLGVGERLGSGPFAQLDEPTARGILDEVRRLAEGPIAESFAAADRTPPVFDPATGTVTMPEPFKRSFKALEDAEWWRLTLPADLDGTVAPRSLYWATVEFVLGANSAAHMYNSGPAFAALLFEIGTADQRAAARHMVERRWGSTMVLTEPDAGSDVGAGRTKAVPQPDGTWHIEGVKRFITSAEHDMAENIVHLVLARPVGAGPGTKGLSLFLVPKFLFDAETGALGERNGVYVTNVEHKMGLKASTTCELRFGEKQPAVGWLVGDVHDGIAQMFRIIEHARMMVGTKSMATLSTGYLNALDFARTRVQSADMTELADRAAPRVTIIHHPDVRRSLMLQKSYAEGLRAVVYYTASIQDRVQEAAYAGTDTADLDALNDLMLPIVKGVSSERAYEQLAQSLQVFGGSGYLQDYPIEQYVRDAKIDSLYEGTTAIQAQDFFFRKIVRNKGLAWRAFTAEIEQFLESIGGEGRLKEEREAVQAALDDVQRMVVAMSGQLTAAAEDPRAIYKVGQNTTRLLMSAGDLAIGYLLLKHASIAAQRLAGNDLSTADEAFYEGKLGVARFFTLTVLPELTARLRVAEHTDNALMDLPETAF
jgi:alkylation response protein AidB-like acyl-CoA dehydrogenase